MHWVDRGAEPTELEAIRLRFTPGWVTYYQDGVGGRPGDARWRQFRGTLSRAFAGLCAYCEETDRGEVDHFRPVSKFPQLVYEWTNWLFACHNCNMVKSNQWPDDGYINPCAEDESERPERFFVFDTTDGKMIPNPDLSAGNRQKAQQMINDLDLNASHHIKERTYMLILIERSLLSLTENSDAEQEYLSRVIDRTSPLSSIARAFLAERGFIIDDPAETNPDTTL